MFALCIDRMSNAMANNCGKLARSSTLKLFRLGSNHCADDSMEGLDPPHTKKRKGERRGGEGERGP